MLLGTAEELSTDADRPEEEALRLAERYEIVVIKLGAGGAVAASGGESYRLRPAATALHGAVGAGDALDGAFLAGLTQGADPERALAWVSSGLRRDRRPHSPLNSGGRFSAKASTPSRKSSVWRSNP